MSRQKLRNAIAVEAARLILRGKETEFAAARKRAARWLSRRKLDAADMPAAAEIQAQLHALSGLFAEEHQAASLLAMRVAGLELMQALGDFRPEISGCAVDGPVLTGADIRLDVSAESAGDVAKALQAAGYRARVEQAERQDGALSGSVVRLNHGFPCRIVVHRNGTADEEIVRGLDADALEQLISQSGRPLSDSNGDTDAGTADEHEYHPDTFASLQILLERLERIQLDPAAHPEGDALYHSLQTFELGMQERPYDEEFLLACLLHDAGLVIDRRNPVRGLLEVLGNLLTERTCFLIDHLADGAEFLKSGQMPGSLRRSEHFDDLVLLARCDRDGRVPGAEVRELEEALDYIRNLHAAWDDV